MLHIKEERLVLLGLLSDIPGKEEFLVESFQESEHLPEMVFLIACIYLSSGEEEKVLV